MTDEQLKKVHDLMEQFENAMLITRSLDNELHARPMRVARVDDTARVCFLTSLDSPKVEEIKKNSEVCVTLQSSSAHVAIDGLAQLVTDRQEVRRLWSLGDEIWFEGPSDPSAVVICVQPRTIEYWDHRGLNGLKFVFDALRAVATGTPPRADSGQHGTIDVP